MHLYFEGLVVEDYYDGTYLVDFGNDEELEHVHGKDMQKVSGRTGGGACVPGRFSRFTQHPGG
jgi:hypothetical protein